MTPAQIKRYGTIVFLLSVFVTIVSFALLILVLGVPIPAFLIPDSIRIDESAREPASIGAVIFIATLTLFGLVGMAEGLWQMIFGTRTALLMRIMFFIVTLIFIAGIIAGVS